MLYVKYENMNYFLNNIHKFIDIEYWYAFYIISHDINIKNDFANTFEFTNVDDDNFQNKVFEFADEFFFCYKNREYEIKEGEPEQYIQNSYRTLFCMKNPIITLI